MELIVMMFKDRVEAGRRLAKLLKRYAVNDAVVYALPRGGVVLGAQIAKDLSLPLDIVLTKKIGLPSNPEYAIGACAEEGEPWCNPKVIKDIDPKWLEDEAGRIKEELGRRREEYPAPYISPKGKIAIIVDDGVATGYTIKAAVKEIRSKKPNRLVVAVPVIPSDTARDLDRMVDDLQCIAREYFFLGAVGAYYDNFPQIQDEEVIELLQASNKQKV